MPGDAESRAAVPPQDAVTPESAVAPPASEPASPSPTRRAGGCLLELLQTLVVTVVLFFLIQGFVAQPFQVQQHSMERTFFNGDYLIVDRLSHLWSPYARGQVIVFQPPESVADAGKPFIKRVIGVAGDTIDIRDGKVFVNGVAIDEPYLYRDASGVTEPTDPLSPTSTWLIPAGQLFVMGDHREQSSDSRAFGPINVSDVIGRAWLRYWPLGSFSILPTASHPELAGPSPGPSASPSAKPAVKPTTKPKPTRTPRP